MMSSCTRLFEDLQKLDYSGRLDRLGLWTLEERRNRADLIEVFKLCKGLTIVPVTNFFIRICQLWTYQTTFIKITQEALSQGHTQILFLVQTELLTGGTVSQKIAYHQFSVDQFTQE